MLIGRQGGPMFSCRLNGTEQPGKDQVPNSRLQLAYTASLAGEVTVQWTMQMKSGTGQFFSFAGVFYASVGFSGGYIGSIGSSLGGKPQTPEAESFQLWQCSHTPRSYSRPFQVNSGDSYSIKLMPSCGTVTQDTAHSGCWIVKGNSPSDFKWSKTYCPAPQTVCWWNIKPFLRSSWVNHLLLVTILQYWHTTCL